MKLPKLKEVKGKFYREISKDLWVATHAIHRAEERGVDRLLFIKKLIAEKENIKNLVAQRLSRGEVRGVFFLTFPNTKGKVVWELMDVNGRRLEKPEDVELNYTVIVIYTYLSQDQLFYTETQKSKMRREKERKFRLL